MMIWNMADTFTGAYAAQKAIAENLTVFGDGAYFAPMTMAIHDLMHGPANSKDDLTVALMHPFVRACVCAFIEHTAPGIVYHGDTDKGCNLNTDIMDKLNAVCNDPAGLADLFIDINGHIDLDTDGQTPGHQLIDKWLERML
jgi:hypothetical protein